LPALEQYTAFRMAVVL